MTAFCTDHDDLATALSSSPNTLPPLPAKWRGKNFVSSGPVALAAVVVAAFGWTWSLSDTIIITLRSMGTTTTTIVLVVLAILLLFLVFLLLVFAFFPDNKAMPGRRLLPQPMRRLGAALQAFLIRGGDRGGKEDDADPVNVVRYVELPYHESSPHQRHCEENARPRPNGNAAAPASSRPATASLNKTHLVLVGGSGPEIHRPDPAASLQPNEKATAALEEQSSIPSAAAVRQMRTPPTNVPTKDLTLLHGRETSQVTPETTCQAAVASSNSFSLLASPTNRSTTLSTLSKTARPLVSRHHGGVDASTTTTAPNDMTSSLHGRQGTA
jgi:hypothetical protein